MTKFPSEIALLFKGLQMKLCGQCGEVKTLDSFYSYPKKDTTKGYDRVCKDCRKRNVKVRRRIDPAIRERDNERNRTTERQQHIRGIAREWNKKHPDGYRAHNVVSNALRDGKLIKGACAVCGSTQRVHAHHSDYAKPLDVEWLCPLHHHRMHADNR
jgi:hypothetical protein